MATPKIHAIKTLPGDRYVAMCWKHKGEMTDVAADVTCKTCLKAVAFYAKADADWQKQVVA